MNLFYQENDFPGLLSSTYFGEDTACDSLSVFFTLALAI